VACCGWLPANSPCLRRSISWYSKGRAREVWYQLPNEEQDDYQAKIATLEEVQWWRYFDVKSVPGTLMEDEDGAEPRSNAQRLLTLVTVPGYPTAPASHSEPGRLWRASDGLGCSHP
jgi:hypothetical protein